MRRLLVVIALVFPGLVFAQDVDGIWQTETSDKGAYLHVRIGNCANSDGEKCGMVTEVFNSDDVSSKGKPIIWAMKSDGANKWNGGRIWAPDDDKTYRSKMQLNGDTLSVEGCVAIFCRGQNWARVR